MKPSIIAAVALATTLTSGAWASIDEEQMVSFEADCYNYAKEDGITGDQQLEEYLARCVQDMARDHSPSGDEPAESDEDKSED